MSSSTELGSYVAPTGLCWTREGTGKRHNRPTGMHSERRLRWATMQGIYASGLAGREWDGNVNTRPLSESERILKNVIGIARVCGT